MSRIRFSDERMPAETLMAKVPEQPADNAIAQVAAGVGKAVEGLINFPKHTVEHIFFGPNSFQNNILTRTRDTVNHMVYGTADLLTGHLLYSGAKALGVEQYTPFFTPAPTTIEGIATDITNLAFMAALPAATRGIKTRMGIPEKALPVSQTPLAQELALAAQKRAESILSQITSKADAAFAEALENSAATARSRGAVLGALVIPRWMLPALNKADYFKLFRQSTISNAELERLAQHAQLTVAESAREVLWERTVTIPKGYTLIPGGEFASGPLAGRRLAPFAMKKTPVTNSEWQQGLEGYNRFVAMTVEDEHAVIKDISVRPPKRLAQVLEAGDISVGRVNVYLKLVDNPSLIYDQTLKYSGNQQPVVGITYFHAQAWLQLQALKTGGLNVYRLPRIDEYRALCSNFGKEEYSLVPKPLNPYHTYFGCNSNVSQYGADSFGVQVRTGPWRLMEDYWINPPQPLKGNTVCALLDTGQYRYGFAPYERSQSIGFSPVIAMPKVHKK